MLYNLKELCKPNLLNSTSGVVSNLFRGSSKILYESHGMLSPFATNMNVLFFLMELNEVLKIMKTQRIELEVNS